ncbi:3-phosphoshikimate 1-carboxyvinyltransferase [Clostridium peptidivorans]|uniref:3-phosphoshikimate 1-carboxyvinyltransferase n=1 Tax=Clostridium peptidivorans TaxID=100174 RepID=UPI000BE3C12B|nr:3-phosphoshikimate 1-carboxyvinyltransferase [Clostridium peptidivorans]
MKNIKITPSPLKGDINIPPSKSLAHRAVICAGLSSGISNIDNIIFSEDIKATTMGMESFGIEINRKDESINIKGKSQLKLIKNNINCNESGSTLRFLIPIALLTGEEVSFEGRGKLVSRPLDVYYEMFKDQGIEYKNNNGQLPLTVKGILKPGTFYVKGNISSQFITGLMFALPLLAGDSKIMVTTELESKGYIDLTIDCMSKFGVKVENKDYKEFYIKGNQNYISRNYRVEGDFSQAAFWIVAGILGANVKCKDLNLKSLQGDKAILNIVKEMGANVKVSKDFVEACESQTKGIVIDASECPDLVPILSVLGALSEGTTRIINAERVRIKECDRLKAMKTELAKVGADIEETQDGLIIRGKSSLKGGVVDSWNDHRIAMAMAVASIKCEEPIIITNSEVVKKSYPEFWKDFKMLGGIIDE